MKPSKIGENPELFPRKHTEFYKLSNMGFYEIYFNNLMISYDNYVYTNEALFESTLPAHFHLQNMGYVLDMGEPGHTGTFLNLPDNPTDFILFNLRITGIKLDVKVFRDTTHLR
ncbi:MAG: hypothetical protein KAR56_03890 [Thermoplasmata archaeon]|nr:hypothetical protein [Thermoplasmata archaeon]